MLTLPGVIGDIDGDGSGIRGRHHIDLGDDPLVAEPEGIYGLLAARGRDGFGLHIGQRLAGTDGGAHGALAYGSAVVAHVALHHLLVFRHQFRNPEGARQHAIGTADAARLERRAHNAVFVFLNRVCRANLGARGILAVPADVGGGGDALLAVPEIEIDHGDAAMRVAFFAGLQARLAADAARRVDVEFHAEHYGRPPGAAALEIRQADTLYSGILLRGSS